MQQPDKHQRQSFEQRKRRQRSQADPELDQTESAQARVAMAENARVDKAAEGQADKKRNQHRRKRIYGTADHQGQSPRPGVFVNQRGKTRQCERNQQHPAQHRGALAFRRLGFFDGWFCDGCHRRLLTQAIDDQNHRCDQQVGSRRHENRLLHSQIRDQKKPCGGTADHRAEGIGRIEIADAPPELRETANVESAEHGQGGAHQHGRKDQ